MSIIQLVGAPGTGKSFYLKKLKNNPVKNLSYSEFTHLFEKYSADSIYGNRLYSLKKVVDNLKDKNENFLIASHLVFFVNGEFKSALKFHKHAKSLGYILIDSFTKDIRRRVLEEIEEGKRSGRHFTDFCNNVKYYEDRKCLTSLINQYRKLNKCILNKIVCDFDINPLTILNKSSNVGGNVNIINSYIRDLLE